MTPVSHGQLLGLLDLTSATDRTTLEVVDQLRFVQSGQIERLFFFDSPNAPTNKRNCRRHLARLTHLGLLHRLERRIGGVRAGSAGHVYTLAPAGRRLQNLLHPDALVNGRGVHEPGLAFLRHTLAVAELYVRLREAERGGSTELLEFEPEPRCWRDYTLPSGRSGWLKPDAFVRVGAAEYEERSFVEVDLGTEGRGALQRKLAIYLAYYRSGREQADKGVFPRVAFLAGRRTRAEQIASLVDATRAPEELFVCGTFDEAVPLLVGATEETR